MRIGATLILPAALACAGLAVRGAAPDTPAASWNATQAAAYLDARMERWSTWPNAARDRDTFCVSCHSAAPYALARPALRRHLGEAAPTAPEQKLLANVSKRVALWSEVAPFYSDQRVGLPKTSESRGTEAVLNALVLSARDAHAGTLADDTRTAFANMWALQLRVGDLNGAWAWLNFHLEPWESDSSPYMGATLALAAVRMAPGGYASSDDVKEGLSRLQEFLVRGFGGQNLFNRLMLLTVPSTMEGPLSRDQQRAVLDEARSLQQADGGWSLPRLGAFSRVDKTAADTNSDGLATALATLAMLRTGMPASDPSLARGLTWLREHQDPATGRWWTASPNKQRDPASEAWRFVSDAGTAYAVLALIEAR